MNFAGHALFVHSTHLNFLVVFLPIVLALINFRSDGHILDILDIIDYFIDYKFKDFSITSITIYHKILNSLYY